MAVAPDQVADVTVEAAEQTRQVAGAGGGRVDEIRDAPWPHTPGLELGAVGPHDDDLVARRAPRCRRPEVRARKSRA